MVYLYYVENIISGTKAGLFRLLDARGKSFFDIQSSNKNKKYPKSK